MALNFQLTDIVTLRELVSVAGSNSYSVQYTPFGDQYFIRDAVPWKGVSGMDRLRDVNPDVADGLSNAHDMIDEVDGQGEKGGKKGVAVIENVKTGEKKLVPAQAAELGHMSGKWDIIGRDITVTKQLKRKAKA